MKVFRDALRLAVLLSLAGAVMAGRSCAALPEAVMSDWENLTGTLDEATVLREKQKRLPESSWLGADQQKTGAKIAKLLRRAQGILLSSETLKLADRSEEIKERLPRLYQRIEEYKNKRIGAPQKSYNPFVKTVKDCEETIAAAEKDVERLRDELAQIREAIAAELRGWGLKLTDAQADVLFSSVVGDSLLRNAVIFENVKGVTAQLTQLMAQNKDDTSIARKYYGMYVTLIDVLLDTQHGFVNKIDGEWRPQVRKISEGAAASLKEARAALNRSDFSAAQKAIFRSNAASNEMTVKAAEQYLKLLDNQKASVQNCIRSIERDREVAANTYATVQHISDMNAVVQSSMQLFDMLAAMQLPEIQAFDSSGVRREFDEITRRLQQK
ncbi:hypothetical protein HMPREF7215_0475 [Pyramidobacter piscolens W5455]|uniref:Uncharacterized protein n=1 Tax=Pyramidobacter piscolens W5455 TaxID=352165 RepID=A0ABM9ZYF2_9BACT|nr:hypothetical protein [Pyramidobacter piscolens]EFB92009.1 hypothetical protein HMPREF7215_0475 [Pyramidobacter piscolens W5455]BDF78714.1 hypothetical protein CE91St28_15080 [Pyramidobacter piscolens]